jgi:polar amino acid transport system substrate-binding protein
MMLNLKLGVRWRPAVVAAVLALAPFLRTLPAHADQLDDVRKAGVLRVAVFDSNPPFGVIDPKSRDLVGYDIDFAKAIAAKLGVRLQLLATNPANRIPLLQSRKVDLLVADVSITPQRAQVLDFSYPYFVTGQQFLVGAKGSGRLDSYATARIAAIKGTTGEQNVRQRFPSARVISYDDLPAALTALRTDRVEAVTQDGAVLAGILALAPDRQRYKLLPQAVTREEVGVGAPKGETRLLAEVNRTLIGLEADGRAARIYDRWFGRGAQAPQARSFKIAPPAR